MTTALVPPAVALAPAVQPFDAGAKGAVLIHGLHKGFAIDGRELPVLDGIDLAVPAGSFTAILGASGCGKSTLLRLIAGLERDHQGEIAVGGQRVTGTSLDRGMVFQDHRLFPWLTVEQNVRLAFAAHPLPRAEAEQRVTDHIALVGLDGFAKAYPHQLSGGMAQRAAIARALVNEPQVLLLDEPLGALDAMTRVRLQRELHRIWATKGVTMILVTHDIEEALFLGQQVVVLDSNPGRIRKIIPVDPEHPRDRTSPGFVELKHQLLDEFHDVLTKRPVRRPITN
jgi:ABC-type nitrate/sulfonate/bicarbonate transport system ATPase subunit